MEFKLFGKVIRVEASTSQLPALSDEKAWAHFLSGKGYAVTPETAVKVAAVLRCVDVVAKTMASLPLVLYERTETGREKAQHHRLYPLLHILPNRHTTAYEFWHMYIYNLMLTRGGFARIVRDGGGRITALWNIPTCRTSKIYVNRLNGERYIHVWADDGTTETLRDGDFMYTPGMRFSDDNDPEDPIWIAADVLGLTMALNGFAKDFFENGSNLGGFIEHPEAMSDTAYERFKESWRESYSGVFNQHKIGFLEEGMTFKELGKDPEKSQALESRKFAVVEVCRVFGVPPHKVFDLERATFSNIEQQNIEYVQESISPMAVRLEQSIYKDLLSEKERSVFYAKFNVNGLLRGDSKARSDYYHNARQDGWMSANDIREMEEMNRIPTEDGGDEYGVNGNMVPLRLLPQNLPRGATK